MKANIGKFDRFLRVVFGIVLMFLASNGTIGWWGWIGIVPLFSGLVGSCVLYSFLGINTRGTCALNK